jgi:hypothetical protein
VYEDDAVKPTSHQSAEQRPPWRSQRSGSGETESAPASAGSMFTVQPVEREVPKQVHPSPLHAVTSAITASHGIRTLRMPARSATSVPLRFSREDAGA